jgi:GTPase SAR1 family protein
MKLIKNNVTSIRNFLTRGNTLRFFQITSEVATSFIPFMEKPSIINGANTIFSIGKALSTHSEVWADEYFEASEWTMLFKRDFSSIIIPHLLKFDCTTIKASNESSQIKISKVDGIEIGWIHRQKMQYDTEVYVKDIADYDRAKQLITNILWKEFGGNSIVIRKKKSSEASYNIPRTSFDIDDNVVALPSKKAEEISTTLKKYCEKKINRSIMLYGPPGTGKSTMARKVIADLNMRSLRIRVEDISDFSNSVLKDAISLFKPDAIILDDFDRVDNQSSLFEMLEFFEKTVKVIFATVNEKQRLDIALLRPGRFDELILIDRLDDEVVKKVLGEYQDAFQKVKDWPIIFIEEYVKRRKVLSKEEAEKSIVELAVRVRDFYNVSDDININVVTKSLKKKNHPKKGNDDDNLFAESPPEDAY